MANGRAIIADFAPVTYFVNLAPDHRAPLGSLQRSPDLLVGLKGIAPPHFLPALDTRGCIKTQWSDASKFDTVAHLS